MSQNQRKINELAKEPNENQWVGEVNAYSFEAQTAMFPGMVNPYVNGTVCEEASVQPYIDRYSSIPGVLAWTLLGAGGGGYLALVVKDSKVFASERKETIVIHIRRQ